MLCGQGEPPAYHAILIGSAIGLQFELVDLDGFSLAVVVLKPEDTLVLRCLWCAECVRLGRLAVLRDGHERRFFHRLGDTVECFGHWLSHRGRDWGERRGRRGRSSRLGLEDSIVLGADLLVRLEYGRQAHKQCRGP